MECATGKSEQYRTQCNKQQQSISLDVRINFILTPGLCASLVSEVVKCLLYEKSQIPYSYNCLKNMVNNKRKSCDDADRKPNITADNHFRKASSALDTMEEMITNIHTQFTNHNNVKEVMVLFGATPLNPKEIYRFKIPALPDGHIEKNHNECRVKFQQKTLRSILLSKEWMSAMDRPLVITNMYVFLKLTINETAAFDYFIQNTSLPSSRSYGATISFLCDTIQSNCCKHLIVYEDQESDVRKHCLEVHGEDSEDDDQWFQANCVLKGFKDSFVKKVPISEMW